MSTEKKTSPWVYVGIGCGVVVGLIVIAVVVVGYVGYRFARQVSTELNDPVAREAKVKTVLGADTIPDGYYPAMGLSIPFLMDMAILSDREGLPSGGRPFDLRGFIYVNMRSASKQQTELKDFFEGNADEPSMLRQQSIRLRHGEVVGRGEIHDKQRRILYVAQRGRVEMRDAEVEGLTAMLLIECPSDGRARLGIWFGPDPDPSAPVKTANFKGSPADESAIRDFTRQFDFCRKQ